MKKINLALLAFLVSSIQLFSQDDYPRNLTHTIREGAYLGTTVTAGGTGTTHKGDVTLSGKNQVRLTKGFRASKEQGRFVMNNSASVQYIDPEQAVNGDGSKDSPWNSWNSIKKDSNTIYLQKRGTSAIAWDIDLAKNGAYFSNVLVASYDTGEKPSLDFEGWFGIKMYEPNLEIRDIKLSKKGLDNYVIGATANAANIRIVNIDIDSCLSGISFFNPTDNFRNILIDSSNISNCNSHAIYLQQIKNATIQNCTISNINMADGSNGDGIELNHAVNWTIQNNEINITSGTGNNQVLKISNSGSDTNNLIRNNRFFADSDDASFVQLIDTSKVTISGNLFQGSCPIGIDSYSSSLSIHYNVFNGISDLALTTYYNTKAAEIYNNVFYNIQGDSGTIQGANNILRNNIFNLNDGNLDGKIKAIRENGTSNISNDYSLYRYEMNESPGFVPATKYIDNKDPLFVDAPNGDFHLNALSPAIDSGTVVGLEKDFYGNPVPVNNITDLGVHEF